jgi:hypothetical protein
MARTSWIQIGGKLYDKATLSQQEPNAPAVRGDMDSFVSPIDGSVVSGRAAFRDHCRRHNVVPTADLAGLPPKSAVQTAEHTPQQRQQTKQVIADIINSRSDLWRQFKG